MAKILKSVVIYMGPELNKKEFTCGGCMMAFASTSNCVILKPKKVNLKVGGCNL